MWFQILSIYQTYVNIISQYIYMHKHKHVHHIHIHLHINKISHTHSPIHITYTYTYTIIHLYIYIHTYTSKDLNSSSLPDVFFWQVQLLMAQKTRPFSSHASSPIADSFREQVGLRGCQAGSGGLTMIQSYYEI